MKKLLTATLVLGLLGGVTLPVQASPEQDLKEFRAYFKKRFPDTPFNDFVNGVYSIDAASREQWEEIEEFRARRCTTRPSRTARDTLTVLKMAALVLPTAILSSTRNPAR
jgi:hypothetical protein